VTVNNIVRVLIPTVGRDTLKVNINSIIQDALDSDLIPIVYLALNGNLSNEIRQMEFVKVIDVSDKPFGISNTLNKALKLIKPGLLWTIADDDIWMPGKFKTDLEALQNAGSSTLLLPRCIFTDGIKSGIRPKIPPIGEGVVDYLFGHFSFLRNPRYITMSGACAQVEFWSRILFPNMESREDITYLLEQEKLGVNFVQPSIPTVKIYINHSRTINRDASFEATKKWMNKYLSPNQTMKFLSCAYAKPYASNGEFRILRNAYRYFSPSKEIGILRSSIIWIAYYYWIILYFLLKTSKFRKASGL
jgi:hypothetical protein